MVSGTEERVTGPLTFRDCRYCGQAILICAAAGTRRNRLYCSERCRTAVYREKKREARALHAEGWPLDQIADVLDSRPAIVRGWIGA